MERFWYALRLVVGLALSGSVVLGSVVGITVSTHAADRRPQALDGMHAEEKHRAMRALGSESTRAQTSLQSVTAPSEPQLLLMERRRIKGTAQRMADAWFYSYPNNQTIHKIIELETGRVVSSEIVIGTQLPLIDAEISRAFAVLLASSADRRALEVAYRAVTGEDFESQEQVSYKAFVFHPDTVVDGLSAAARRCGTNRCAQMLIYTHDNIALDMSPVVDLSTGKVLQNLELRAQAIVLREEAAL